MEPHFRGYQISHKWAVPEKIQTAGIEDMEFSGVLKKYHVGILVVNYKRSEISRGVQEKIM